jgi:Ca2+-binding RTX toxin-like protein
MVVGGRMTPLIDLSIGALSPTGTFAPGTNVTVSADVHLNDGFVGLVQTSFFLSNDAALDASDPYIGFSSIGDFSAGQTRTFQSVWSVPYMTAGNYNLIATTASYFTTEDGPLDNNVTSVPFNISYVPPEVSVFGNGVAIADNSTSTSILNGTDFGDVFEGSPIFRHFTVTNTGTDPLTTSGMTLPPGFTLVKSLAPSIAPGASDIFLVNVQTNQSGVYGGNISFTTNDTDEGQFDFAVRANVIADDFAGNSSTIGSLTVGGSATGQIGAPGDQDWFGVQLTAGTVYSFEIERASQGFGNLALMNASGVQLASENAFYGSVPKVVFRAPTTDTYYLNASGYSPHSYTVTTNEQPNAFLPDFGVGLNVSGSTTLKEGSPIVFNLTLNNFGESWAGTIFPNVYLSNDSTITSSDLLVYSPYTYQIDHLESIDYANNTYFLPSFPVLEPGTYYLGAIADAFDQVVEGNEANNLSNLITITVSNEPFAFTEGADNYQIPSPNGIWHALGGNDTITGSSGNDTIYGDAGDDLIIASLTDYSSGTDTLDGGDGIDTVRFSDSYFSLNIQLGNLIDGVRALGSAASIYGEEQSITIANFENVVGSFGFDTIGGDEAANFLDGHHGVDTVTYEQNSNGVFVSLVGNYANTGNGVFDTLANFENVRGSYFDDVFEGNTSNNQFDGGAGSDTVTYYSAEQIYNFPNGVTVYLGPPFNGLGLVGDAAGDTFLSIENIIGTNTGDDVLGGNDQSNFLNGFGGNDNLLGGGGGDSLHGGDGNDLIDPGQGSDHVVGGNDVDTLDYRNSLEGVGVQLALGAGYRGDAIGDGYDGIENVKGSLAGSDVFYGNAASNVLEGFEGDEEFMGSAGADTHDGGVGNDTSIYANSVEGVTITLANVGASVVGIGGDAAGDTQIYIENIIGSDTGGDTLIGNDESNFFNGNGGADVLNGGLGKDGLFGGLDVNVVDTFLFTDAAFGYDYIGDFVDGIDKIQFQGVAAVTSFADLAITQVNATLAWVAINGDELSGITVQGQANSTVTLTESDFIFS